MNRITPENYPPSTFLTPLDFVSEPIQTEGHPPMTSCREDPAMLVPMPATQSLARDFLEIRAKILEVAACLDRIDRGEGSAADDPRLRQIHDGLAALTADDLRADRAERIQRTFSLPYDAGWRKKWEL
jgi:hypothetical protein